MEIALLPRARVGRGFDVQWAVVHTATCTANVVCAQSLGVVALGYNAHHARNSTQLHDTSLQVCRCAIIHARNSRGISMRNQPSRNMGKGWFSTRICLMTEKVFIAILRLAYRFQMPLVHHHLPASSPLRNEAKLTASSKSCDPCPVSPTSITLVSASRRRESVGLPWRMNGRA